MRLPRAISSFSSEDSETWKMWSDHGVFGLGGERQGEKNVFQGSQTVTVKILLPE